MQSKQHYVRVCGMYMPLLTYTYLLLVSFQSKPCAAQPGGEGVGDNVPHFWDQRGTGGQGVVQWRWSLLLLQTVFIQYCTIDWISTPLTLIDTCQVNNIWKDGLGRVSTVHPTRLLHYSNLHAHMLTQQYTGWPCRSVGILAKYLWPLVTFLLLLL